MGLLILVAMNFHSNRRGVELAISTIVIIAIAVLVVLVLVGYFLGSFGRSGSALSQLFGEGEKGVSDIKLERTCIGGSQCGGITDEQKCEETTGCYWGFGQSSGSGGSGGSGGGTQTCTQAGGDCDTSANCKIGGTNIGKYDCPIGQICCKTG